MIEVFIDILFIDSFCGYGYLGPLVHNYHIFLQIEYLI
jgi:hypothetical protein